MSLPSLRGAVRARLAAALPQLDLGLDGAGGRERAEAGAEEGSKPASAEAALVAGAATIPHEEGGPLVPARAPDAAPEATDATPAEPAGTGDAPRPPEPRGPDLLRERLGGPRRGVETLGGAPPVQHPGPRLPGALRRTGILHHRPVRHDRPDPDRASVLLHDVSKVYPNGKRALVDVDLVVPDGDFVFLVGPSGAGKSTLIKLLIRDELATRGNVYLIGQDVSRLKRRDVPRLRRRIGTVFQDFKLLPSKTVRENVAFALEVTGTPHDRIGPAVDRALALVGLTNQAEQRPNQLSGGEQQRTAIARSMVHEPRIIIADEPTGNLDPLISWEIIQLLLRINELGTTVLMATHNAEVVTALRRRVVALEEGHVVRDEVGGYRQAYA